MQKLGDGVHVGQHPSHVGPGRERADEKSRCIMLLVFLEELWESSHVDSAVRILRHLHHLSRDRYHAKWVNIYICAYSLAFDSPLPWSCSCLLYTSDAADD